MSAAPPTSYANHVAMHRALDAAPMLKAKGMGSYELLVLLAIARHASTGDSCWLSYATIARESLCGERTVCTAVHNLRTAGFILKEGQQPNRTNRYRLTLTTQEMRDHNAGDALSPRTTCATITQEMRDHNAPRAHEVVPEVMKEVVKGSSTRTSTAEDRLDGLDGPPESLDESHRTGKAQTGGAGGKAPASKPISEDAQSDPAILLAEHYFGLLGEPRKHKESAADVWPHTFRRLLGDYTYADLRGAAEWAFFESDFWQAKMDRRSGDPVEYFADKIEKIMPEFRIWKQARANAKRKEQSAAAPKPMPGWMRNAHIV